MLSDKCITANKIREKALSKLSKEVKPCDSRHQLPCNNAVASFTALAHHRSETPCLSLPQYAISLCKHHPKAWSSLLRIRFNLQTYSAGLTFFINFSTQCDIFPNGGNLSSPQKKMGSTIEIMSRRTFFHSHVQTVVEKPKTFFAILAIWHVVFSSGYQSTKTMQLRKKYVINRSEVGRQNSEVSSPVTSQNRIFTGYILLQMFQDSRKRSVFLFFFFFLASFRSARLHLMFPTISWNSSHMRILVAWCSRSRQRTMANERHQIHCRTCSKLEQQINFLPKTSLCYMRTPGHDVKHTFPENLHMIELQTAEQKLLTRTAVVHRQPWLCHSRHTVRTAGLSISSVSFLPAIQTFIQCKRSTRSFQQRTTKCTLNGKIALSQWPRAVWQVFHVARLSHLANKLHLEEKYSFSKTCTVKFQLAVFPPTCFSLLSTCTSTCFINLEYLHSKANWKPISRRNRTEQSSLIYGKSLMKNTNSHTQ